MALLVKDKRLFLMVGCHLVENKPMTSGKQKKEPSL